MMPSVTRHPLFWAVSVAAIFVMAAAAVFTRSLNHDAAWYLYMADAMRGGAALYRDVADTNPPLIVFPQPAADLAGGPAPSLSESGVQRVRVRGGGCEPGGVLAVDLQGLA
jgi:hypothetical protein